MKNIRLFTVLGILLCITLSSQAQNRKTVYGNKKVVSKEREAGSFDGLRVSSGIDVFNIYTLIIMSRWNGPTAFSRFSA